MYQNSVSRFASFPKALFVTSTSAVFIAQRRDDCTNFFFADYTPSNMSARASLTFRIAFISHGAMRAGNRRNEVAMAVTLRKLSATFASRRYIRFRYTLGDTSR